MCVDADSRPPIPPIAGGSADTRDLRLASADGTRFMAHAARAASPTGAGMVVIPDVRGLHPYYQELADRFAEAGVDAVAIDFFARTAPSDDRGESFDFMAHVPQTKPDALQADIAAAAAYLRGPEGGRVRALFSVGFCFGGALSYFQAASGLGYAGVIGFYGWPLGLRRWPDRPRPIDAVPALRVPRALALRRRRRRHPPGRRRGVRRRLPRRRGAPRFHRVPRRPAQLLRPQADGVPRRLGGCLAAGAGVRRAEHRRGLTGGREGRCRLARESSAMSPEPSRRGQRAEAGVSGRPGVALTRATALARSAPSLSRTAERTDVPHRKGLRLAIWRNRAKSPSRVRISCTPCSRASATRCAS